MAKGDVDMKFDANTAAYVTACLAAQRAAMAGADGTRKFGEDAEKSGDKLEKFADKVVDLSSKFTGLSLAGGAIGVGFSVAEKAIDAATEAATRFYEVHEERGKKFLEEAKSFNQSFADASQADIIPEIREHIEKMGTISGHPVNKDNVEKMAGGIASITGDRLGDKTAEQEKVAIDLAASLNTSGGMSVEKSTQIASTYMQMAILRNNGGYAGSSDDDLQKIALKMGSASDRELQELSESKDREKTARLIMAARQNDLRTQTLSKIDEFAVMDLGAAQVHELIKKKRRTPREFTAEDQAKLDLSKIAPGQDRVEAILANPNLAPPELRRGVEALKRGMAQIGPLQSLPEVIAAYQTNADEATRTVTTFSGAESIAQDIERSTAQEDAKTVAARKLRSAIFMSEHPYLDLVLPNKAGIRDMIEGNMGTEEEMEALRQKRVRAGPNADESKIFLTGNETLAALEKMVDRLGISQELLQNIRQGMQQNNALTAQQTQAMKGQNHMLNSNHPGQQ